MELKTLGFSPLVTDLYECLQEYSICDYIIWLDLKGTQDLIFSMCVGYIVFVFSPCLKTKYILLHLFIIDRAFSDIILRPHLLKSVGYVNFVLAPFVV